MRSPINRFMEQALQIAIGMLIGSVVVLLFSLAGKQAIKDECETKLLYQQEQYRVMLRDSHRLYTIKMENAAQAEVVCLDVENMTARELLWHMEDIFSDTEVAIK